MRRLLNLARAEIVCFVLLWVALSVCLRSQIFNDPGALWHVRVGELILDHGFMTTDPFTYTYSGETWIPQQWGGEVAMALAHRIGGLDTMLLGFTLMMAMLYTWLFSRLVRGGMHPVLAGVILCGVVLVSAFHFYARPHVFTIAGMAITMAALTDYERGHGGPWRLWWLIPFGVLWTNIHGGVLGGVLTTGLAMLGWGIFFLLKKFSAITSWRQVWLLAGVLAAFALTPFVNPFGLEMLHTWQKIVGSDAMKEFVSEHQALSLSTGPGQAIAALAVLYVIALAGTLPKMPRITWLLPLVWFVLSFKGIRQGPLFAVLAVVSLADFWPETIWHKLLLKYGDSLARIPEAVARPWRWVLAPLVLALCGIGLQSAAVALPLLGHGWARFDRSMVPVELLPDLQRVLEEEGPGTVVFNDANLGGFMIYHAPQVKVFMDDRFELYGDAWMRNYVNVLYDEPERFEEWAKQYQFRVVIIGVRSGEDRIPLEKYLSESPDWVVVSRCDCGLLAKRAK